MLKPHELRGDLVWHYTTLEALQLILQGGTLLATEVSYQNDPREPSTAEDLISEAFTILQSDRHYERFAQHAEAFYTGRYVDGGETVGRLLARSRFIFCASEDPDNLYAWRTYGAGSRTGCAIGLDPAVPLGMVGNSSGGRLESSRGWTHVQYDGRTQLDQVLERLGQLGDEWYKDWEIDDTGTEALQRLIFDVTDALAEITASAKHPSFREEKEMRVTFSNVSQGVVFSPGANGPRPRIRLATSDQWGDVIEAATRRLPIRAVVLAPNARREAVTTAQWLLHANGYPLDDEWDFEDDRGRRVPGTAIQFAASAHPYRDV